MTKETNIYLETSSFIVSSYPLSHPSTKLSLHISARRFSFDPCPVADTTPSHEDHLHFYYFSSYLEKLGDTFPVLGRVSEKESSGYNCTPEMAALVTMFMNCRLRPEAAALWYEAKALELITLALERAAAGAACAVTFKLSAYDTEMLHTARELLVADFENIPTIKQLARKVGTNDYKLKRGFKQLFGSSVFAYVQHVRLEKAKELLLETEMEVADIAYMTGYSLAKNFSAAFKRKYGMGAGEMRDFPRQNPSR